MITAPAADVTVDLVRLFEGIAFLPEVELDRGVVSFEVGAEGRKNWLLDREQQDESARAAIGRLRLRDGRVSYDDPIVDTSIAAELIDPIRTGPAVARRIIGDRVQGERQVSRASPCRDRHGRYVAGIAR